jgi:hypothetical protein
MGVKRPHEGDAKSSLKKQKSRFAIGPANLPDGTHRRKSMSARLDFTEVSVTAETWMRVSWCYDPIGNYAITHICSRHIIQFIY